MILVIGLILGVLTCASYFGYWAVRMKDKQLLVQVIGVATLLITAIGLTAWTVMK